MGAPGIPPTIVTLTYYQANIISRTVYFIQLDGICKKYFTDRTKGLRQIFMH